MHEGSKSQGLLLGWGAAGTATHYFGTRRRLLGVRPCVLEGQ